MNKKVSLNINIKSWTNWDEYKKHIMKPHHHIVEKERNFYRKFHNSCFSRI